jgi:thiol-disulfide isomerase/thioredoxin
MESIMATPRSLTRRCLLAWLAATSAAPLLAQPATATPPASVELSGAGPDGRAFSIDALRGQVVLVFYWSTECPVCRNKMPELLANAAGWKGQKFTLLGVNMDEKKSAFLRYEEVVAGLVPPGQQFLSVWGNDPSHRDNLGPVQHLPSAVLIGKDGRVVERYSGRIPPQAWDRIADLL